MRSTQAQEQDRQKQAAALSKKANNAARKKKRKERRVWTSHFHPDSKTKTKLPTTSKHTCTLASHLKRVVACRPRLLRLKIGSIITTGVPLVEAVVPLVEAGALAVVSVEISEAPPAKRGSVTHSQEAARAASTRSSKRRTAFSLFTSSSSASFMPPTFLLRRQSLVKASGVSLNSTLPVVVVKRTFLDALAPASMSIRTSMGEIKGSAPSLSA